MNAPLVAHTVPLGDLSPEAILDAPGAGPRGFFADDRGETAWLGAARSVEAHDLSALSAQTLGAWEGVPERDVPPRAFVVARFTDDPRERTDDAWKNSPGARWVLPRLTLTRERGETVARWLLPPGERPPPLSIATPATPSPSGVEAREGSREAWVALVEAALREMSSGGAEKLVAARRVELRRAGGWRVSSLLRALAAQTSPGGARFSCSHGALTFLGATPETLLARDGATLTTEALAGSLPRDPSRDDLDRAALLASDKDRREHDHVTRMILRTIAPWCAWVDASDRPEVRSLRTLHHLCTPITAALRGDAPGALAMAAALHPTPAVAGAPVAQAAAWIRAHETHPRGWYAGAVGWCDARGDGRFTVAIRSAALREDRAWVYAGAGLVLGSDPAKEWEETAVKMAMMREVLGA